jgi:hypothetical protein
VTSKSEFLGKVVLKGKLDAKIVRLEAIQKVFSSSPLKLASYHRVLHGIEKKISEPIMAAVICIRPLAIRVVDIHE